MLKISDDIYLNEVNYNNETMREIRTIVFINEQHVSHEEEFVLQEEKEAISYLINYKGIDVGTIRYRIVNNEYKLERFAILKEYRGLGIGKSVIRFISDYLASKCDRNVVLNGQYQLIDFYTSLGYIKDKEPFIEANIKHQRMIYKK